MFFALHRPLLQRCAKKFALRHCGHRVSAKKFAQHTKNGPEWVFYAALGELLRGNAAGGAVLGEFFRGNAVGGAVLGEFFRGNAVGGAVLGEFFREPAVVGSHRASLLHRAPGSWALLLAVLTLQCAAKPYGWHGGQPAQATTYRVNVRIKGRRHPPIGLTCASKGPGHHLSG